MQTDGKDVAALDFIPRFGPHGREIVQDIQVVHLPGRAVVVADYRVTSAAIGDQLPIPQVQPADHRHDQVIIGQPHEVGVVSSRAEDVVQVGPRLAVVLGDRDSGAHEIVVMEGDESGGIAPGG